MIKKIFTIYDSKAEVYGPPFFYQRTGEAIRAFEDLCIDPKTKLNQHSEDFTLFEIGMYDETNGQITSLKTPHPILKAIEAISAVKNRIPQQLELVGKN